MPRLVLASSSPRRAALLRLAGFEFDVEIPAVDETPREGEPAAVMVRRVAEAKALAVSVPEDAVVLAADTAVVLGDDVLGKPADVEEAVAMLRRLAGRRHRVCTGWAIASGGRILRSDVDTAAVGLRAISEEEVRRYAAGGEPLDKAGAYALQGDGRRFVTEVRGSRSTVVGLPLRRLVPVLEGLGVPRSGAQRRGDDREQP